MGITAWKATAGLAQHVHFSGVIPWEHATICLVRPSQERLNLFEAVKGIDFSCIDPEQPDKHAHFFAKKNCRHQTWQRYCEESDLIYLWILMTGRMAYTSCTMITDIGSLVQKTYEETQVMFTAPAWTNGLFPGETFSRLVRRLKTLRKVGPSMNNWWISSATHDCSTFEMLEYS